MKFGRNDSCPCGSGKKYKKCCIGKSESEIKEATYALKYLGEYLDPSMVSPYTDDPLDVQAYLSDLQER